MRPPLSVVFATVGGLVVGAASMVALQAPALVPGGETASGSSNDAGSSRPEPSADLIRTGARLLLVWSAGGLPDGLAAEVATLPGVEDVTTVAGDRIDLTGSHTAEGTPVDQLDDGWAIPLDALAVDPEEYGRLLPKADQRAVAELPDGQVLLSATSAELRGLRPGDALTVEDDRDLLVHAIVDDTLVGAAELVVTRATGTELGVATERFLLLTHEGGRSALEQALRRLTDVEVRVRGPGETPFLRHGDAVLPQSLVKLRFGEFAYRLDDDAATFAQDPSWVEDHLATVELPVLGRVRCHRSTIKQLEGALEELVDRGLAHHVDADQFAGCHAARLVAPDGAASRHAWGVAIDLNAEANPHGEPSVQDPRLIETMARWGFTWGGFWLVPDPMHFEYVGPPEPTAARIDDGD